MSTARHNKCLLVDNTNGGQRDCEEAKHPHLKSDCYLIQNKFDYNHTLTAVVTTLYPFLNTILKKVT